MQKLIHAIPPTNKTLQISNQLPHYEHFLPPPLIPLLYRIILQAICTGASFLADRYVPITDSQEPPASPFLSSLDALFLATLINIHRK